LFDRSPGLFSELKWLPGPAAAPLRYLTLQLTGVASLTVDVARAGLASFPSSTIAVATDTRAQVTLAAVPADATVQLDGKPTGLTVAVPQGRHQITLTRSQAKSGTHGPARLG
jgi:hypothetical protein